MSPGERNRVRREAEERELLERAKRPTPLANPELVTEGDHTGGDMEGVDIRELEVNMEKHPWGEWTHKGYGDDEFDSRLVREARTEEVQYMVGSRRRGRSACRIFEDHLYRRSG